MKDSRREFFKKAAITGAGVAAGSLVPQAASAAPVRVQWDREADVVLLTEEALYGRNLEPLAAWVAAQPPWSVLNATCSHQTVALLAITISTRLPVTTPSANSGLPPRRDSMRARSAGCSRTVNGPRGPSKAAVPALRHVR